MCANDSQDDIPSPFLLLRSILCFPTADFTSQPDFQRCREHTCLRSRCLAFTFSRKDWVSSHIPISGYAPPMVYSSQELGDHASFTLSSLLPLFPTLLLRATTSRYWCRHLPSGALKLFLRVCLFLYKVANSVLKGERKRITILLFSERSLQLLQRCTAAIPALSRQRLEDCEFKAGLGWGTYSKPTWDSLSHYISKQMTKQQNVLCFLFRENKQTNKQKTPKTQ